MRCEASQDQEFEGQESSKMIEGKEKLALAFALGLIALALAIGLIVGWIVSKGVG